MAFSAGSRLGSYEIAARIGAGGMGEVYKAVDTRLGRTVAIKVLPEDLASDPERKRRLEREARTISNLNHPHICTLYDIGEQDGFAFLVMEYLEGETLAERLVRQGAFAIDDAIGYATQIASALDKAHQWKVVHRDLKPGNVMLTESGAKVLDFGIATRLADADLETVTRATTTVADEGGIAGTVPYMPPEALRGEPVDARSDVWALGVLLYEMLGGRRPFAGATGVDMTSAILRDPPPPLPATVPEALQAIVRQCLMKDPAQRYQRAGEVRAALQAASTAVPTSAAWGVPHVTRRQIGVLAASAVALALLVGVWNRSDPTEPRPAAPVSTTALAVLPFDSLAGDAAGDYMSEGMTDALITELSKIGALRVASRTSVMGFLGSDDPTAAIAGALGVDVVLGGTVVVVGDQVRVTAELVDAASNQNLWAKSFDRDFTNILALQSEIAREVATQVRVTVTPEEAASMEATRPVDRAAYEAYLEGEYYALRWPAGLPRSIEAFERSIEEDPGFAPAYAGLSSAYTLTAYYGSSIALPYPQRLPRAKDLAERALDLDDSLAQAHLASGGVKMAYEWDWAGAKAALERALTLDPDDTSARYNYAVYLAFVEGRTADAVAFARQTLQQDQLSVDLNTRLGMLLYYDRQWDEAIAVLERVLERDPTYSDASVWLGHTLAHVGRIDEVAAIPGGNPRNHLIGYVIAGRPEEARRIVQQALEQRPPSAPPLTGYSGGYNYSLLGDFDRAFEALNDFETRDAFMSQVRVDPRLDLLRDDPRFDALLVRMNFPGLAETPRN